MIDQKSDNRGPSLAILHSVYALAGKNTGPLGISPFVGGTLGPLAVKTWAQVPGACQKTKNAVNGKSDSFAIPLGARAVEMPAFCHFGSSFSLHHSLFLSVVVSGGIRCAVP